MKTHASSLIWACVLAAGGTQASADIFTWLIDSGFWEDPTMWNGPVGQYPDSILDSATISGPDSAATLTQNLAVGSLTVLSGAGVYSSGHSIFVNGDTTISGQGSSLSVTQTASLRDFDTNTLSVSGGVLAIYSGLAQFDESLLIGGSGAVLGAGTIEMNSTSDDLVIEDGVLWAVGGSGPSDTLLITRTESSTSELDWTDSDSNVQVWGDKVMVNELPYAGLLGGVLQVASQDVGSAFESVHGIIAAPSSDLRLSGAEPGASSRVAAPFIDWYGAVTVSGIGLLDTPIAALRGQILIQEDSTLRIDAGLLSFDSIDLTGEGENAIVRLGASPSGSVSFIGGDSSVVMGAGSRFDLDGAGNATVNIAEDASLWLEAEFLDYVTSSAFDGTLNIDGALHVEAVNDADAWTNAGEINLDGGEITGRVLVNDGVIRGTGSIDAFTTNNGEIVADGGTLQLDYVLMDGEGPDGAGVLRAQTGDLIMNMQYDGLPQWLTGSIFVGDGEGIRENLNADVNLVIRDIVGVRGSMSLNSGFVVLHAFDQGGDLTVQGVSLIRTTGVNPEDRISFVGGGVNTIVGTLEVDGETWFVPGAQFNGEGLIHAVSTIKRTFFQEDSDLADVGFASAGPVHIWSSFQDAQASVRSLTLEPTAELHVDMNNSFGPTTVERYIVHENAALSGDLVLEWAGDDSPPVGETVTVLEAGSVSGGFDSIDDSGLGENRRAFVTIDADSVRVFITCAADLNADGVSNFFDVSMFLAQFQSEDPAADLNEDGVFNFFDVSIYLGAFEDGCL